MTSSLTDPRRAMGLGDAPSARRRRTSGVDPSTAASLAARVGLPFADVCVDDN
jgi:hypothetical protein